ncbi:PaaX family transcriptional regulator C-terminal domain-containing protein [Polycladomyces subterraneus]|uniref:PaaX family transcriptional regulator n=1 Tax=Polycladomyces subterraneus TaxID=1016997 RepID=A0ABT8IJW1_9BACL|nr:PaaX family transcriptional regulator C-terminal domain-containing protein [Polycladomyces subterraneus]MDN4592831.1 PaaX family transcriptional regulator [Polycladomyces subterraneus]
MISLERQILYILMRKPEIEVSELIDIYNGRRYSSQSIRNALSRLKRLGYIRHHQRRYSLTPAGTNVLTAIQFKLAQKIRTWNGTWHLVMYQIPESHRSFRNTLRQDLIHLGYGQLYHSVFLSPHNQTPSVKQIIEEQGLSEFVSMFTGHFTSGEIDSRVNEIWDLKHIRGLYGEFLAWVSEKRKQLSRLPSIPPWDAFFEILELVEHLGNILLQDPILPNKFLPKDWPGPEAWRLYRELYDHLIQYVKSEKGILQLL